MKNKLILGALAAAAVAPLTVSAADVTYSGVVQTRFVLVNDFAAADNSVAAGDVRFGFEVSETVGDLTGFATYRIDADGLNGTALTSDNTTVGIKSGSTTFKLGGVDDVEFGLYANDIAGEGTGSGSAVGLTGSAGALNFGAYFAPPASGDEIAFGAEFAAGPVTIGASSASADATDTDKTIIGAKTTVGGITLAAHSYNVDAGGAETDVVAIHASGNASNFSWGITSATTDDVSSKLRLDLGTTIAGLGASFRYESTDFDSAATLDDAEAYVQLAKSF